MIDFIDSSVLIAAMVSTEEHHRVCDRLFDSKELGIYAHGIAETFSTLTGGRRSAAMSASLVSQIIEDDYLPLLTTTGLTTKEMLGAMREAQSRGVRGGGIYDYLHLVAARKAKARRIYTLNVSNFKACHRAGDPDIVHPGE